MFSRRTIWALAAAVAIAAIAVGAAQATPSSDGTSKYCLDGATVTLPVPVSAEQGSRNLTEGIANVAISTTGGAFFFGYAPNPGGLFFVFTASESEAQTILDPGYTEHFVSAGACSTKSKPPAPMPPRVAVCSPQPMLRGDGTMGVYQDIPVSQWLDSDSPYFGMPAAKYVQPGGSHPAGTTCDNVSGYTATGQFVDESGLQQGGDTQVYPEYTSG